MAEPGSFTTDVNDMLAVHAALLRAFDAADDLVANAGSDPASVAVVGTYFENVLAFLLVHHQGEDELLYPLLEQRCPEQLALLERIDAQHALLHDPMARAGAAVTAWVADPVAANGAAVSSLLDEVEVTLRPHLGQEEQEVLPIASAYVSEQEWAQLSAHGMQHFSGDKPWLALGLIRELLTDDQRAAMLEGMPPPVQDLWKNQWEPAFNGFIAEVRAIDPAA